MVWTISQPIGLGRLPANKKLIPAWSFKGGPSMAKARLSFLLATLFFLLAGYTVPVPQLSAQGQVSLTVESWRNDDLPVWQDTILPAFTKHYQNIKAVFGPNGPTEVNGALHGKFSRAAARDMLSR